MNVTLPKGESPQGNLDALKPGHWAKDEDGIVFVRCPHETHSDGQPRIGAIAGWEQKPGSGKGPWNIDADGNVTPSIFFNDAGCGWHVFAKLEGWTP